MRQTVIRDFVVLKNALTAELPPVVIMHLPSRRWYGHQLTYKHTIENLLKHPEADAELVAMITH
jgi:hypothetical protein